MKDTVYMLALRNEQNLIVRAAEIEAGLWNNPPVAIQARIRYKGERDSVVTMVDVVTVDPYRLRDPYLVRIGNETKWVAADELIYTDQAKPAEQ